MASRQSVFPQPRSLTLTEELEKLEQSITLTLQEIDHNFSRAHQIVTSSILPIVESYAHHSKDVWEGSKFWKQFFESSANVSLSGYEEQPSRHDATDEDEQETATEDESTATSQTNLETSTAESVSESYDTPSAQHITTESISDIDFSNLTISPSHSTPRPPKRRGKPEPTHRSKHEREWGRGEPGDDSPYNGLRQEVNTTARFDDTVVSREGREPHTPPREKPSSILDDVAMTPEGSPTLPPRPDPALQPRPSTTRKKSNDPVLHRVLDRTYRVQATPLTADRHGTKRSAPLHSTFSSSPEVAPPQLHAEIFSSPERRQHTGHNRTHPQRTPGVSVLTPARNRSDEKGGLQAPTRTPGIWDSDEDDGGHDGFDDATGLPFGASPPKTMQFHVPQNRLLKTPAREASKQIVDDILASAGIKRHGPDESPADDFEIELDDYDVYDGEEGEGEEEGPLNQDNSPSVVRRAVNLDDETF